MTDLAPLPPTAAERSPLVVPCLTCLADIGDPCGNGYGGQAVFTHTVRRATADLRAAGVL